MAAEYDVVCLVRGERVAVTVYFDSTVADLRTGFIQAYGVAPERPPRLLWRGALLRDLDPLTDEPTLLKSVGIVEEGNAVQVSLLPDSYDPDLQKRLQAEAEAEKAGAVTSLMSMLGQGETACMTALEEAKGDVAAAAENLLAKRDTLRAKAAQQKQDAMMSSPEAMMGMSEAIEIDEDDLIRELDGRASKEAEAAEVARVEAERLRTFA
eukprot:CAMPEP_0119486126 /NCGR_PEP_ID=MMETSP1344-20130328/12613_1 /TAXON_ID=236787 /ORGANISM="Florenciella parvula, Strain CCMP2471" /LENGTH=209 /DNA_ID=CAMNT_0007520845 /DNA_START=199 /DNA_END=825 /DNA_ORIENTATION=-